MDNMTEKRTDIVGLILLLWEYRKLLIRNSLIAFVLAVIIAFSIPKLYTSDTLIAPEFSSENSILGGLSSIASIAGVDFGGLSDEEAIYPDLYPAIVTSTPFLVDMLKLEVETQDKELKTDLYDYLLNHQNSPWWSEGINAVKNLFKDKNKGMDSDLRELAPTEYTREQTLFLKELEDLFVVTLGKTTSIMTVSATMQDPLIAATVSQAMAEKLQYYVDNYRTKKYRDNVAYLENLSKESLATYKQNQEAYSSYVDANQNPFLESVKTRRDELENELQLSYSIYQQVVQQLEAAKAKLQEKKPISAIIQPALIPVKASSPKKMIMAATFVFMAFFGTGLWLILKDKFKRSV